MFYTHASQLLAQGRNHYQDLLQEADRQRLARSRKTRPGSVSSAVSPCAPCPKPALNV